MTELNSIISTFSSEEQQRFVLYLNKKNKRKDTKNVQLFKLLCNSKLDSKTIFSKLYNGKNRDAYHALRKRLFDSIIDFIANTNLEEENSIDMQIIKYILASRTFLLHNEFKTAYKILDKAEALAKEHQLFPILNEIYHTKIQYAYTNTSLDLDDVISKFKSNQKHHYIEDQLNIAYAKIRQSLHKANYEGKVIDFQKLIDNTLKEHKISFSDSMSFKSFYQLMSIASISAFTSKDYIQIEPFILNTYEVLKTHKQKDKQLYYHMEVLYMIANTLFRNKKFEASQKYLELMRKEMLKKRKKYFNNFQLKYILLKSLNLNFSGNINEAIANLENVISKKHKDIEAMLDIYLSLVMLHFQKGDFKKASNLSSKFYHTDKWYIEKAGIEWVIKKNIAEILLHLELVNFDLFESRIRSFKRKYTKYLKEINQERVLIYLGFVESYYKNPEDVNTRSFFDQVESSFEWIEAKREDIFVMSFYAWLKSKMDNTELYATTIELVEQHIMLK